MKHKKLNQKKIGKTKIYIGDHLTKVEIFRTKEGTLRIAFDCDEEKFPKGTTSDMCGEELTISPAR